MVTVIQDDKAWTLLTTLQELKGFEESNDTHGTRPKGVEHGSQVYDNTQRICHMHQLSN